MGLDITAYKNLKKIEVDKELLESEDFEPDWEKNQTRFYINPAYKNVASNISNDYVYEHEKSFGFRAGSYSGYNNWREQLAKLAKYPANENYDGRQKHSASVWENPVAGAFLEIINFSDCEGVIGSEISKKLAKDFADFQDNAEALDDEYFLESYNCWRKAFEMASDNGCVEFH